MVGKLYQTISLSCVLHVRVLRKTSFPKKDYYIYTILPHSVIFHI